MTACSACGAPVERPGQRQRLGGDLLEYCRCSARCGQTTCLLVESCTHARAQVSLADDEGEGEWLWQCPDCGHAWTQLGAPSRYELMGRQEALWLTR